MNDMYNNLQQGTPHLREKSELDHIDTQIRALNRALNLLMALLRRRKILTKNETGWVAYIKSDVRLALTVDKEDLLEKFLDLAAKVPCPRSFEGSIALIRNHQITPVVKTSPGVPPV